MAVEPVGGQNQRGSYGGLPSFGSGQPRLSGPRGPQPRPSPSRLAQSRFTQSRFFSTAAARWKARADRTRARTTGSGVSPAELVAEHARQVPDADVPLVLRAFATADELHIDQKRSSGEPFVIHPLAVAQILAELGADSHTLAAALLHDTVEDTPYDLAQLSLDFGPVVARMVSGVTKLDGSQYGDRAEPETYRRMITAASDDVRVLVIKLADRLHNLSTLGFRPPVKQKRVARQSMELLVPFAERLGIYRLKRDMQDWCLRFGDPDAYAATEAATEAARTRWAKAIETTCSTIRESVAATGVQGRVMRHDRHLFSVHSDHSGHLHELRPGDITRLVVVVAGGESDCYVALGGVHGALQPVPARFKDFIAAPKYNLYRSLHTTVIGAAGQAIDVLIRTEEQHLVAERGAIADLSTRRGDESADGDGLAWLSTLVHWQRNVDSENFLDDLRLDLTTESTVTVVGDDGQPVELPAGATVLDFAYAHDPSAGVSCLGALIDGRTRGREHVLTDGVRVQVLTAPDITPTEDWLTVAVTAHARAAIRRDLLEQRSEDGRGLLRAALSDRGITLLEAERDGDALAAARRTGYRDLDSLYAKLADGDVEMVPIVDSIVEVRARSHAASTVLSAVSEAGVDAEWAQRQRIPHQAAEQLGYQRLSTAYDAIATGELPATRLADAIIVLARDN